MRTSVIAIALSGCAWVSSGEEAAALRDATAVSTTVPTRDSTAPTTDSGTPTTDSGTTDSAPSGQVVVELVDAPTSWTACEDFVVRLQLAPPSSAAELTLVPIVDGEELPAQTAAVVDGLASFSFSMSWMSPGDATLELRIGLPSGDTTTLELGDFRDDTPYGFVDADNDGHGGATIARNCDGAHPTVTGDCDDDDPTRYPTAPEVPGDEIDSDCDGMELCYEDGDGDEYGDGDVITLVKGTSCDATGLSTNNDDCDDNRGDINPDVDETPNDGLDSNCDGMELCPQDLDGDGVAGGTGPTADLACEGAPTLTGDCNDDNPWVYPGAAEVCDGEDNACTGLDPDIGVAPITHFLPDDIPPVTYSTLTELAASGSVAGKVFICADTHLTGPTFLEAPNGDAVLIRGIEQPTIHGSLEVGARVVLEDLSFSGGPGSMSGPAAIGGALYVTGPEVLASGLNITCQGGSPSRGGGIAIGPSGHLELHDTVISECHATLDGGGIHVEGSLDAYSVDLLGNSAASAGGGIAATVGSTGSFTDGSVDDNHATTGGGMMLDGSWSVTDVDFERNRGDDRGGAIYMVGDLTLTGTASPVLISGNRAEDDGGGIYQDSSAQQLALDNVHFLDNTVTAPNNHAEAFVTDAGRWASITFESTTTDFLASRQVLGTTTSLDITGLTMTHDLGAQPSIVLYPTGTFGCTTCAFAPLVSIVDEAAASIDELEGSYSAASCDLTGCVTTP